jgi:HEAT repeat protein
MDFLRNLRIERTSFWIGFIAGMLFLWLLSSLRRFIPFATKAIKKQIQIARENAAAGVIARLRNDVFIYAQHQHLAAAFSALDDILIQPRVLAPPSLSHIAESGETTRTDITSLTLPYMPDWPEICSLYGAPTLTLVDALQGDANLILMGNPGSGRTVSLAHLASLLAKRDSSAGKIAAHVPLLLHAQWLNSRLSTTKTPSVVEALSGAASTYTSAITTSQLPGLLRNALETGRILLLVDGFDEISPEAQERVKAFLEVLLQTYRKARIVVATSTSFMAGLNHLGLYPVAMAAWNEYDRTDFIKRWKEHWSRSISPAGSSLAETVDPLLLNSWLSEREFTLSPLEFTLKVWGAFAGDLLGPDIPGLLESHIRRLSVNITNAQVVLERLAVQMVMNMNIFPTHRQAERWIARFDKAEPGPVLTSEADEVEKTKKTTEKPGPTSEAIYNLTANGLLTSQSGITSFCHPVFLYYLAGQGFANSGYGSALLEQPDWTTKNQVCAFWGYYDDISSLVDAALSSTQDPLYSQTFRLARWLRISPKSSSWRNKLMRQLVDILNRESFTAGIGGRAVAALALSGDPTLAALFRQMIKGNLAHLRHLGALGCGFMLDSKSINDLTALFGDEDPRIVGAACLALVAIGSKPALESVMALLLQGSENARLLAAEALANNVTEGYPALEEAATLPDLLVRRSAVFGLSRTKQPWAIKILEKMEIEDGQWVVRTAATQVMDEIRQPDQHIPHPLPPLFDTPWLINFAGKLGMGVTSGKQALDLVIKALETGEPRERLSALEYLQQYGGEEALLQLYQTYFGSQATLREAAFNTLWHYHASGMTLPPPLQYGLH